MSSCCGDDPKPTTSSGTCALQQAGPSPCGCASMGVSLLVVLNGLRPLRK